jgi:hypothetical protein
MRRWSRILPICVAAAVLAACSLFSPAPPPAGPGDPHIAKLRFDPDRVVAGQTAIMSFYFEVPTADIKEAVLLERGIAQFQLYQALGRVSIDLTQYSGQVAGTAEVPVRWGELGVRLLELHVVTHGGRSSNRIRATLTVR